MEEYGIFVLGTAAVLFLLGLGVLIRLAMTKGTSPSDRQVLRGILAVVAWFFVGISCLAASSLSFHLLDPVIALVVVAAMAYGKHLDTQRYALLGLVAVAAERSVPLAPAIQAFARERRGWLGRRIDRLAGALLDGVSLPEAQELVPNALPREAAPLVRVGCETGSLPAALRQAASARDFLEPIWQTLVPKVAYTCLFPWVGVSIIAFIMLKIVPQFEKIFRDFGTKLPAMTQAFITASRNSFVLWPLFELTIVASTMLVVYTLLRYAGVIHWDLPGTGRFVRRLDSATVLDALALVAARQQPMVRGIAALAASHPKSPIRRRLQAVLNEVTDGADWCKSLRLHGLLRQADLAVLQAAARVGNLAWAMREMADSNRRRFTYRTYALVQVLFPPIVLAYGLVAMFVVVALFMPLLPLINNLSQ